jgi:lipopolysaccharide transport system ATP-binding protein
MDLREGEFYAVRNVSFELRRGECLGLIGHNGALPDLLAVAG